MISDSAGPFGTDDIVIFRGECMKPAVSRGGCRWQSSHQAQSAVEVERVPFWVRQKDADGGFAGERPNKGLDRRVRPGGEGREKVWRSHARLPCAVRAR